MTFAEAQRLLGIEPGADAQAVRRAYIAAVKARPPERDPEGFQQVRAAYELLRHGAPAGPFAMPIVLAQPPAAEPETESAPDAGSQATVIALPLPDPIQPFYERTWETEHAGERVAIAMEAVVALGSADAYQLLIDAYDGDDDAQLSALREAIARGHGETFAAQLAERFPEQLEEDELARWHERIRAGRDPSWTALASAYLARRRADLAAELATSELARVREDPFAVQPPRYAITQLWLGLLERGEIELARTLRELEAAVFAGERPGSAFVARQEMAAELCKVAGELPRELLAILASGLREGDADELDVALERYHRRHALRALFARRALARDAPLLFQYHRAALGGWRPAPGHRPWFAVFSWAKSERPWYAAIWAMWLIAVVIRMLMQLGSDEEPRSELPAPSRPDARFEVKDAWLTAICHPDEPDSAPCREGERLRRARSCRDAAPPLARLERAAQDPTQARAFSPAAPVLIRKILDAYFLQCRPVSRFRKRNDS